MSHPHELPPNAAALLESMRDIGYSLETAVADLIDNSIGAGATEVAVVCPPAADPPYLIIADNGKGMDESELIEAMRHGGNGPKTSRASGDLGRFGLGLKTASFSQCRRLTVVSSQSGAWAGARWDLELVARENRWLIDIIDRGELAAFPHIGLLSETGTVICWEDLDRIVEDTTGRNREEIIADKLEIMRRHLSLVFHRFLSGECRIHRKLAILINGVSVDAFDPFCRSNPATQRLPEEVVHITESEQIVIKPYVLPHHSKLSPAEYDLYKSRSNYLSNQGVYVYRNDRLMAWGDWFRLVPKNESTKLARVSVDFTPPMDEAWAIDIRKARARPPFMVRERMKQLLGKLSEKSADVHRHRGARLFQPEQKPLWSRVATNERILYKINEDHPIIAGVLDTVSSDMQQALRGLLRMLSSSLPVQAIYSDYASDPIIVSQSHHETDTEMTNQLRALISISSARSKDEIRQLVLATGLFDHSQTKLDTFIEKELMKNA